MPRQQLSLFEEKAASAPVVTLSHDYLRKTLGGLLRTARHAEIMPWNPSEAAKWEHLLIENSKSLPEEEGSKLREAFQAEMKRLRAVR